jgi:hypothetical protein
VSDRPSVYPPGTRARIVKAYDERLVGRVITITWAGKSYAQSVRDDGFIHVRAPELEALRFDDATSYDFGGYCRVELIYRRLFVPSDSTNGTVMR